MKKYMVLGMFLLSAQAFATRNVQRVLKDATTMVALELTDKNVFCTALGYGTVQLKVNVPELDHLAHFDHRVVGEGRPCITGGECSDSNTVDSILNGDKVVAVPMRVILSEYLEINDQAKTCTRTLVEDIKSHIKGKNFVHRRTSDVPVEVPYDNCIKIQLL
jgi:hypothetical protein